MSKSKRTTSMIRQETFQERERERERVKVHTWNGANNKKRCSLMIYFIYVYNRGLI